MRLVKLPILIQTFDEENNPTGRREVDIWIQTNAVEAVTPLDDGNRALVWLSVVSDMAYLVDLPIEDVIGRLV